MTGIQFIGDLVESNGKTIRENNLAKQHAIPIGTLVEVDFSQWLGRGMCMKMRARLRVVAHTRDCDGTPLYSVGRFMSFPKISSYHGFAEDALKPIELTKAIEDGDELPSWYKEKE